MIVFNINITAFLLNAYVLYCIVHGTYTNFLFSLADDFLLLTTFFRLASSRGVTFFYIVTQGSASINKKMHTCCSIYFITTS